MDVHTGAPVPSIPALEIGAVRPHKVPPGVPLQTWRDTLGRVIATGGRDQDSWWMHWPGLATFRFGERGSVRAEPAQHGVEALIEDVFVRGVTPVVLLARDCEGLHASAVLGRRGLIAFCADSGTGKSTLALALSAAGLPQFADDTVMYRATSGTLRAFSLKFPPRVDEEARRAIDAVPGGVPRQVAPRTTAPFAVIYELVRDRGLNPGSPQIEDVPPTRRFETLLAHAHPFELAAESRRRLFMERLLQLARTTEVCRVRFAPDLTALSRLVSAVRRHAGE